LRRSREPEWCVPFCEQAQDGDTGDEMIEALDVGFSYVVDRQSGGGVKVLDGVTLSIVKGDFVVVLGRNGSGKSTLARMFNALLLPTSGLVRIGGMDTRDETRVWEVRRRAGMVFPNPDNQLVGTTIEEDTAFGPENLGLPPETISMRVREALRAVAMTDHAGRAPHLLSGGEKQRVSLAGILAMKPECIILDEATAMLDSAGRDEILSLVRRLNREEGITVVHITHDMDEAVHADRILVLDAGRVVLDGKPATVFANASRLKELGLELPQVTELCYLLQEDGFDLPPGILEMDEAVAALLVLGSRRGHDVRQN
jgi:energy-coupling factor transport system ATP-binding protein